MSEKLGFIGLGIMGGGMAANLLRAGHEVTVWNRTASRMEPLVEMGASQAGSPREVAERSTVVMICVSDTPDVVAVTEGPDGILAGLSAGSVVVDHSTISPSETRRLAGLAEGAGSGWLDGPVSGGSEGAALGTLSIMVGGEASELERVRPYLEAMGKSITHTGPVGSGQMVKLVNQVLVVVNQLAASEALLLAEVADLDLEATLSAVTGGAAGSWMLSNRGPQMIVRDWRPGFTIDLQQKDLRLVLEAADELGVPLPGTALVFQLYRALQRRGLGAEGNHALVKALEHIVGAEVGSQAE
nr:NAD(P)-dependent oxidoreductase [bacterium]